MTEKCNKYESMFIFGSEEDLLEHIKICSDCKKEYEQEQKISNLVKEIAPYTKRKPINLKLISGIAAGFVMVFLSFWIVNSYSVTEKSNTDSVLASVKENSIVVEMGLPADEYGLLSVEN